LFQVFRFTSKCVWEESFEPGHIDIDRTKVCGVGPGLAFSKFLLEMGYPRQIGAYPIHTHFAVNAAAIPTPLFVLFQD
jgi:hypothetical protein